MNGNDFFITITSNGDTTHIQVVDHPELGPCIVGAVGEAEAPFTRKLAVEDYNDINDRLCAFCDVCRKGAIMGTAVTA